MTTLLGAAPLGGVLPEVVSAVKLDRPEGLLVFPVTSDELVWSLGAGGGARRGYRRFVPDALSTYKKHTARHGPLARTQALPWCAALDSRGRTL